MHNECGPIGSRMLDRAEVRAMVPGIGDAVVGASFCPPTATPTRSKLLQSLHKGLADFGGDYLPNRTVDAIDHDGNFIVRCGAERFLAARVAIAAGLGSRALAPMVGLSMPVTPLKGQILVTEPPRPCSTTPPTSSARPRKAAS
jgi:glycine/D-amino acid oxidase-like deaminating enzyme